MSIRQLVMAGATVATLTALGVAAAPLAGATNVDVSVSSACQATTWVVTATAHNIYTQPLDVRFDNSVELVAFHLDPGQQQSSHISAPGQTFTYQWSATTAHLIGTLSGTLTRPVGCGVLTQQTEPPTTTCAAAIPPRTDCGGTTSTSTSTPPTSTASTASTRTSTPPSVTSAVGSAPATSTPPTHNASPTTIVHSTPNSLPTTGSSSNAILAAAFGLITVGVILAATRRGRRA